MQHQIEVISSGYTCKICQWTWDQPPQYEECPGVKRYAYGDVPDNLVSLTELRRRKLKPGGDGKPVGVYRRAKRPYTWLYFYDAAQALPCPEPTEKQRAAIAKARVALIRRHTCERCGWYDKAHGRYSHQYISTLKEEGNEKRFCTDCCDYLIWTHDRHVIEHDMAVWMKEGNRPFVVVDTETVGLPDHHAFQVIEVSAVDRSGVVVFHSLIKPDIPVPPESTNFHGLTDQDLARSPTFLEIWPTLVEVLGTYEIFCYGADFDSQAILRSAKRYNLDIPPLAKQSTRWHCVLTEFATYYGEWSQRHKGYRYKDLHTACHYLGIKRVVAHRAVEDALDTLSVMRALAERGGNYPAPEERPPVYRSGDYYGEEY